MGFPLKDWIDKREGIAHNLAHSGMKSALSLTQRVLSAPLPPPDPSALRRELAAHLRVPTGRLFLTHGATEANGLVLFYLRQRSRAIGPPTVRWESPEYPPLGDAALLAGYRRTTRRADVAVLSSPNNPTGAALDSTGWTEHRATARWSLVDETFREFTPRPSVARQRSETVFVTGTFTKAWAGDPIRVGYAVAPATEQTEFGEFHGLLADELPLASVAAARALLAARDGILAETRALFRVNLAFLQDRIPDTPELSAPVWFDRGSGRLDGDRFARALLKRQVLVCPGRFFGDPRGVRICLTQRTFPEDLEPYLQERRRWV